MSLTSLELHSRSATALARGLAKRKKKVYLTWINYLMVTSVFYYQSLGVTLVESTYSPQRQASPPITSFFCASVPVLERYSHQIRLQNQTPGNLWFFFFFGSYIPSLYSTGLHVCAQEWQTFQSRTNAAYTPSGVRSEAKRYYCISMLKASNDKPLKSCGSAL